MELEYFSFLLGSVGTLIDVGMMSKSHVCLSWMVARKKIEVWLFR